MFSDVTMKDQTPDMAEVEKDVTKIMKIVEWKKELIIRMLEDDGKVSIDKLPDVCDNYLDFDLQLRYFDKHWEEVRRILEEKLGLRVCGNPRYFRNFSKNGKTGKLEMTFHIHEG